MKSSMRISSLLFFIFLQIAVFGQTSEPKQSVTLLFVGDVMGHSPQIKSAFDEKTQTYHYHDVFAGVSPLFNLADITIANLEVTLGGEPYTGYPQFSSPDELVDGIIDAGVDVLVTANNHTVDRRKKGILRTIDVLNKKGVPYAGSYADAQHRDTTYPLILEHNGIRLALLSYTYGTNGIPVPRPTVVNLIDTALIRADYLRAQQLNADEVIVYIHWGNEYQRTPCIQQLKLTQFMHNLGIRLVIGSHPHVIQRMEASFDTDTTEGRVAVYSLGNFVSNQRPRYRNGGALAAINIVKENGKTRIADAAYALVWVHTPIVNGKKLYRVLPVAEYERRSNFFNSHDQKLFNQFVTDSRSLLDSENYNFPEIAIRDNQWVVPWLKPKNTLPYLQPILPASHPVQPKRLTIP
ncbi:MAG: CapA family protein [Bacteroidales bacterium]|nr:CapA family protein [Bacteroidales bacterium]MDD4671358.1 CapA family protein [Bacteroidales bacterium]MDY0348581.1 CapA family protein [Tenuifilaceae bacterium]